MIYKFSYVKLPEGFHGTPGNTTDRSTDFSRVFLKKIVEIHDFPVGFSWKTNLKSFWKVSHGFPIIAWWFSSGTSVGLDKLYNRLWNLEGFSIFHRGDLICWRKRTLLGCAHEIMDHDQRYEMSGHETIVLYQLTLSYLISILVGFIPSFLLSHPNLG